MPDYRRKRQSYVSRAGGYQGGQLNAEVGGLCKERCEEDRRGGRLEEEDKRQRRLEKTNRRGGEKVAGSISPLTKGKEEERDYL